MKNLSEILNGIQAVKHYPGAHSMKIIGKEAAHQELLALISSERQAAAIEASTAFPKTCKELELLLLSLAELQDEPHDVFAGGRGFYSPEAETRNQLRSEIRTAIKNLFNGKPNQVI